MRRNKSQTETAEKQTETPTSDVQTENVSVNQHSSAYASMILQAGKVQTAYRTGAPVTIPRIKQNGGQSTEVIYEEGSVRFPGIMTLNWYPTLGVANDATSPVNMASKAIYSQVRKANSGSRNYQASDLQIYLLSLDSLFGLYYQFCRVVGLLNAYTPKNLYYPEMIVESLGFDYHDWVAHQPEIIFQMANWAGKLNNYALPTSMKLYQDHMLMNTVIYRDGDTDRAQLYAFVQDCFYTYEVVDQVKGLTPRFINERALVPDAITKATWAEAKALMNTMLEAYLNSDDVALISGDIYKAFEGNVYTLPIMDESYATPFVKDWNMLLSIQNADIVNVTPLSCRAEDSTDGNLRSHPAMSCTLQRKWWSYLHNTLNVPWNTLASALSEVNSWGSAIGTFKFLNFADDEPAVDAIISAFRFKVTLKNVKLAEDQAVIAAAEAFYNDSNHVSAIFPILSEYEIASCGTEIVHAAHVWSYDYLDGGKGAVYNWVYLNPTARGQDVGMLRRCTPISQVMPMCYNVASKVSPSTTAVESRLRVSQNGVDTMLISNFDWHPKYIQAAFVPFEASGVTMAILRSSAPIIDTQNVVPIDDVNIAEFNDAWLFASFFN